MERDVTTCPLWYSVTVLWYPDTDDAPCRTMWNVWRKTKYLRTEKWTTGNPRNYANTGHATGVKPTDSLPSSRSERWNSPWPSARWTVPISINFTARTKYSLRHQSSYERINRHTIYPLENKSELRAGYYPKIDSKTPTMNLSNFEVFFSSLARTHRRSAPKIKRKISRQVVELQLVRWFTHHATRPCAIVSLIELRVCKYAKKSTN